MAEHTCRTETASGSRSLDALGCAACAEMRVARERRLKGLPQRIYLEHAKEWGDVFEPGALPWATPENVRHPYFFVSWESQESERGGGWVMLTHLAATEARRHLRDPGGFKVIEWADGRVLVVASNRDHVGDIWLAMLESAASVPRDVLTRSSMADVHAQDLKDRKARGER